MIGLTLLAATPIVRADEPRSIAVIVSAQTGLAANIHASELNLIYWRKKLYGIQGQLLRPANLSSEHPIRLRFSDWVLHSTPQSQIDYWNGMYFHGVQPPHTVQSEEAMLRYVADTPFAIGYVDACHVDDRVRTVFWLLLGKVFTEPPAIKCELN